MGTDLKSVPSVFLKKGTSPVYEHVEKASFSGCSKMPRCKAPEILSREAYFMVR
jgi:hypothetical protein